MDAIKEALGVAQSLLDEKRSDVDYEFLSEEECKYLEKSFERDQRSINDAYEELKNIENKS